MDKNPLGGGNPNSLYVPMSEDEQEVLHRLVDAQDLKVVLREWGVVSEPKITVGDLRLTLVFTADFNRPDTLIPVHWFDLELWTHADQLLFGPDRLPALYGGKPTQIAAGVSLTMAWDIAIQSIGPQLVKQLKPGAIGLTSAEGNRRLDAMRSKLLRMVRQGEASAQADTHRRVVLAMQKVRGGI